MGSALPGRSLVPGGSAYGQASTCHGGHFFDACSIIPLVVVFHASNHQRVAAPCRGFVTQGGGCSAARLGAYHSRRTRRLLKQPPMQPGNTTSPCCCTVSIPP